MACPQSCGEKLLSIGIGDPIGAVDADILDIGIVVAPVAPEDVRQRVEFGKLFLSRNVTPKSGGSEARAPEFLPEYSCRYRI